MPESRAPVSPAERTAPFDAAGRESTLANKTGSWKYIRPIYRDCVAPCNEGCPVGIDIEGYLNLLREDRVAEALDLLLRENPMPATTGRVCDHPCELACNRRFYDESVSIRAIERMLGDLALESPLPSPLPRTRRERVAIVGSGPAGLSCAYHLARLGYGVTVYEADDEPGGVLRLGIPEYRLPKAVLAREIERLRSLGIEILCGVRLGVDLPWRELRGFDAVFLGTGAHEPRGLGVEGERVAGVRAGLSFLRDVNFGARPELGRRVVVIGGGNTAMDCARTALRLGSETTVLYRRTRAEMPAIEEEVGDAEREGIAFQFLALPVRVRADNGRVTALECVRTQLGPPDASGRRRPVVVEGSEFSLAADTVLVATGEAVDFGDLPPELCLANSGSPNGAVAVDDLGATRCARFHAGGDVIAQPRTVAHALGSGKRAAIGIHRHLRAAAGESADGLELAALKFGPRGNVSITRWRGDDPVVRHGAVNEVVPFEKLNLAHFPRVPRRRDRHLPLALRRGGFDEVSEGLARDDALAEARRCFNCGVCNLCELCLIFCPDVAIARREDGTGFDIAYDYCKGCGLCNAECPRGAMEMTREGL